MLDLTKQYSTLFRKKGGRQLLRFAHDVTKSGKLRELSSFAVWELLHQLHLFPKSRYIRFREDKALALGASLLGGDFNASVERLFESRGLSARVSSNNWKLFYTTSRSETFGCL